MMNKESKKNYIEEMKKVFSSNKAVMVAHYQGLNVVQLDELRKELRENSIIFKITKNRITKIAVKDSPCKDLEKFFTGPTAAAISSDAFLSAKILSRFAKKNDKLKIIAGFMDGAVIDQSKVAEIALLPTIDEARAKIVAILTTPAQKIISILLAQSEKMANLAPAEEIKK